MPKLLIPSTVRIDSPESTRICESFRKKTVPSRFAHHWCRFYFSHRGDMATPAAVNPSGKSQIWHLTLSKRFVVQVNRVQLGI